MLPVPRLVPVAAAYPRLRLAGPTVDDEMAALAAQPGRVLLTRRNNTVLLARGDEIPTSLLAIGAHRAAAFRALGEGTDDDLDLDAFDSHYRHLIVWNDEEREIVGAYRLAISAPDGLADCGQPLYTSTLFDYEAGFFQRHAPGVELGRAFVQPRYQRAVEPLFLLWQGIGKLLARNPECRYLFGAVSISKLYQPRSRRLILSYLQGRQDRDAETLVRARKPAAFRAVRRTQTPTEGACELRLLEERVREIEGGARGVPVLIHRYVDLGAQFLAYHDDEIFRSIACLVVVDVRAMEPRALTRFMGKDEAESYRAHQP